MVFQGTIDSIFVALKFGGDSKLGAEKAFFYLFVITSKKIKKYFKL
jgi:hypothetical protein